MRTTLSALLFVSLLPCSGALLLPAQEPAPANPAAPASQPAVPTLAQIQRMIDKGHPEDALKSLEALRGQQPVPPGVDRVRGKALYAQYNFVEADKAFAAAMESDPHDEDARQMRGLALYRLGKPAEAIPVLEQSHDWTDQTKVDPSYILALCYMDTRRYDDARHAFARQYGFAPDSAQAYLLASRMLLRREFVPISQEYAKKALELNPDLPLAHGLLGEIALARENLDEAISEFEKERDRNPLYGGVYDRLGDAYSRDGDYSKAQQSLQRAVLLEPNATGPYILLGRVLFKRHDLVGAMTYLERAVKMDPSNYMSHSLLGQVYHAMGRTEDASRELKISQDIQQGSEPKLEGIH